MTQNLSQPKKPEQTAILSNADIIRLKELETVVKAGLKTFYDVGQALIEIRDKRLYRQEFKTFEDYCLKRWEISKVHAHRFIAATDVVNNLKPTVPNGTMSMLPTSESHTRPLRKLDTPQQQRDAWKAVIDTAPIKNGVPQITQTHVEQVVDNIKQNKSSPVKIEQAASENEDDTLLDTKNGAPEEQSFNYKRDMKSNRLADEYTPQGYDACQTPPYAVAPVLPYLQQDWLIWEPAFGEGYLGNALTDQGYGITTSDILTGQNFFDYEPEHWDVLVTNPPFSLKYKWMERCYELGKPFALLLPVETLGAKTGQEMFREFGIQIILMDSRVNFKMPNKGWDGGGAQFPTAWFTWGLSLEAQLVFAKLNKNVKEIHPDTTI